MFPLSRSEAFAPAARHYLGTIFTPPAGSFNYKQLLFIYSDCFTANSGHALKEKIGSKSATRNLCG